jgi:hypothetical protein
MPMDRSNYPPDWASISRQIRDQANDCCEFCGVPNGAVGARDMRAEWHDEGDINGMNSTVGLELFDSYPTMIRIVLTVAHLCHDTTCIDPTHMRALCQRCHLNYDREQNQAKAAATIAARPTRQERAGQLRMEVECNGLG